MRLYKHVSAGTAEMCDCMVYSGNGGLTFVLCLEAHIQGLQGATLHQVVESDPISIPTQVNQVLPVHT